MHRQDHSSTGLHPLAVSYANPLTYMGEDIVETHFEVKKQFKKIVKWVKIK